MNGIQICNEIELKVGETFEKCEQSNNNNIRFISGNARPLYIMTGVGRRARNANQQAKALHVRLGPTCC